MKLYSVTIRSAFKLSRYTLRDRCKVAQSYWWLKGPYGFIDIGTHRGDKTIELTLELPARYYTLGCGPSKPRGIREKF